MRADKLLDLGKKRGVTLVEILLVVTLSALFMVAIIPFIRSVNDTWSVGASKTEILQNGRGALEMLSRYIRQAPRITRIPGASGDYIKLRDRDDTYNIILYHNVSGSPYYIGVSGMIKDDDLVMRSDSTGTYVDSLLASSLDSFTFNFFQDNGSAATEANQVKSCQIQMELSDPLGVIANTLNLESVVSFRQDVKVDTPVWAMNSGSSAPPFDRLTEICNDVETYGFRVDNVVYDSSDCLALNLIDGSCWVADTVNNSVKKISADGTILVNLTGFSSPNAVSVNEVILVNGRETVWVADTAGNRIRRIYWTGSSWTYSTFTGFKSPSSVSVNPDDPDGGGQEVCWVADTANNRIKKLSSTGSPLVNEKGFSRPRSVSVNRLTHYCWVADTNNNRVKKISPTGDAIPVNESGFSRPRSVSVNRSTDECWVADTNNNRIKKLSSSGELLVDKDGFAGPQSVSANFNNNTCWVADYGNNQIVRLNADGDEEFRISGFINPLAVAVKP